MKNEDYGKFYVQFKEMSKNAQRTAIKAIFTDSDLDYRQTLLTLSFFVNRSRLSPFEKSRLLSRFPRSLKVKCVAYCRANNIVVTREKTPFVRPRLVYSYTSGIQEEYTSCLFSRHGTLKFLYFAL